MLQCGEYHFSEVLIRQGSTIIIDLTNGMPLTVRVSGDLTFGIMADMQVIGGDASDIVFLVDGSSAIPRKNSTHYGTFIAPNGEVIVDQATHLSGAAWGADVTLRRRADVNWVFYQGPAF